MIRAHRELANGCGPSLDRYRIVKRSAQPVCLDSAGGAIPATRSRSGSHEPTSLEVVARPVLTSMATTLPERRSSSCASATFQHPTRRPRPPLPTLPIGPARHPIDRGAPRTPSSRRTALRTSGPMSPRPATSGLTSFEVVPRTPRPTWISDEHPACRLDRVLFLAVVEST